MRSSSVVQTCCGPVHAERKNDSNPAGARCCSVGLVLLTARWSPRL